MIGLLEGEIICKGPTELIIKVGGVGYRVHIPLSTFYALPEPPARISLLIHTRVQEDALNLYGFGTPEEKELFLQLLAIPRIGARMALNILSGISPGEFAQALAQRDIRRLASIPGIGKNPPSASSWNSRTSSSPPGPPSWRRLSARAPCKTP